MGSARILIQEKNNKNGLSMQYIPQDICEYKVIGALESLLRKIRKKVDGTATSVEFGKSP